MMLSKNLLSLKSQWLNLEAGKYVFEVDTRAHKLLIKQAVEAAFEGVKVANVNTVNVNLKQNALDVTLVLLQKTKKAIITLAADSKAIELFVSLKLNNLRRKYRGNSCL